MKRVGVMLCGCGVKDGSEIHEAVCTLLAIDRADATAYCMAPDDSQTDVIDHFDMQPLEQTRNMLCEAARIARGVIVPSTSVSANDVDALVFPGGLGCAKNMCTFASEGRHMRVHAEAERLIQEMHSADKPMGFICIAPLLAARMLGTHGVRVTLGDDAEVAAVVESWGAKHEVCSASEITVDESLKIVTTPAYMLAKGIAEVAEGVDRLVRKLVDLM